MPALLFPIPALSDAPDFWGGNLPAFAIMLSNPATPDDAYFNIDTGPGIFTQQAAKLSVGFSDMHDACFHAMSTAYYGFLGSREDGGASNAESGYIVGDAGYFAGASGVGYGTFGPFCDDPCGIHAEYNSGPFNQDPDGSGVLLLGVNRFRAKVVTFDLNATTGDQEITGVGFAPEAVIFLGCVNAADGVTIDGTNWMMGAAGINSDTSALTQWTGATRSQFFSGSPLQRYSVWYDDNCISHIGASSFSGITTVDQLAEYVSSNADGFTINLSAAGHDSAGTPMTVRALCLLPISGGVTVGNGTQGDTSIDTSPVQAQAMLFCSTQRPANGVVSSADCYAAVGAVDYQLYERAYWEGTKTGSSPLPNNWSYTSTLSSIRWADEGQNLLAEANATLNTSPAVTSLDWTTDGGQGYGFGWIAFSTSSISHIPDPVTLPASAVTPTGANLNGLITPNSEDGVIVSYYFDWGPTTGYGFVTPGGPVGDGFSPLGVSDPIVIGGPIGYHFRVVAVDEFGCECPGEDIEVVQSSSWRQIRRH